MLNVTSEPQVSRARYVPESQDFILEEALPPPVPVSPHNLTKAHVVHTDGFQFTELIPTMT